MLLMTYAGQLIAKGIEPDINTLEYWGENPPLQARVKPALILLRKCCSSFDSSGGANAANGAGRYPHGPRAR